MKNALANRADAMQRAACANKLAGNPMDTESGDGETPQRHDFHRVQDEGQDECRAEY
jgi:hypothetical protein